MARNEWGFAGLVMTDWGTTSTLYLDENLKYGVSDPAECIRAGNDLIMPGCQEDVDRIVSAAENGALPIADLQACARRVLTALPHSLAYRYNGNSRQRNILSSI